MRIITLKASSHLNSVHLSATALDKCYLPLQGSFCKTWTKSWGWWTALESLACEMDHSLIFLAYRNVFHPAHFTAPPRNPGLSFLPLDMFPSEYKQIIKKCFYHMLRYDPLFVLFSFLENNIHEKKRACNEISWFRKYLSIGHHKPCRLFLLPFYFSVQM